MKNVHVYNDEIWSSKTPKYISMSRNIKSFLILLYRLFHPNKSQNDDELVNCESIQINFQRNSRFQEFIVSTFKFISWNVNTFPNNFLSM